MDFRASKFLGLPGKFGRVEAIFELYNLAWQSIRVRREAAVAQAVNDFLQNDLLAQASSESQSRANAKPDPNVTVRTLLDRAAQRIDWKFTNQPEVEFALRNTMGAAYSDLGIFPG